MGSAALAAASSWMRRRLSWSGVFQDYVHWPVLLGKNAKQQGPIHSSEILNPIPLNWTTFSRIHADFFYFDKKVFLVIVDSYTKWIEVELMRFGTDHKKVIKVCTRTESRVQNVGRKAACSRLVQCGADSSQVKDDFVLQRIEQGSQQHNKRRRDEDSDSDSDFYGFAADSFVFQDLLAFEEGSSQQTVRPVRKSSRRMEKRRMSDFVYY